MKESKQYQKEINKKLLNESNKRYLKEGKKIFEGKPKKIFEEKQKIFEWILKESKTIWRKVKKTCSKAKIFEGKQNYLKEIKTLEGKQSHF